jgi:hypothetical protein
MVDHDRPGPPGPQAADPDQFAVRRPVEPGHHGQGRPVLDDRRDRGHVQRLGSQHASAVPSSVATAPASSVIDQPAERPDLLDAMLSASVADAVSRSFCSSEASSEGVANVGHGSPALEVDVEWGGPGKSRPT